MATFALPVLTEEPPRRVPDSAQQVSWPVVGMTCAGCASRIERALQTSPGVHSAGVNFATATATVAFDPAVTRPERLMQAVCELGYDIVAPTTDDDDLSLIERQQTAEAEHQQDVLRRWVVSAALTVPVVVIAMSHGLVPWFNHPAMTWLQLALTLPVMIYGGGPIFRAAWTALRHGGSDMNVLVALGTWAAFLESVVATIAPARLATVASGHHATAPVYFEAAATIITLVLFGRWLEARAKHRAGDALRQLLSLQPPTARVVRSGQEADVPVSAVIVGDRIVVRPGEKIAVDGVIETGQSTIDESLLTGESWPVAKSTGSKVFAGTINGSGAFEFTAQQVGKGSVLQQIVRQVRDAQSAKAPIARLADTVAGSTFMVEMTETARILNAASAKSLVILDEIGRGTSTYDGISLAWAITEYLHDTVGCRTLFATHYHELTQLSQTLKETTNWNVAVRETGDGIAFLHKIVPGAADKSYGIHVAQLAGVPAEVLSRARVILDTLEADHIDETGRTKIPARQSRGKSDRQLSLFEPPPHPLLDEIRQMKVDELTPLAALQELHRLQQQLAKQ